METWQIVLLVILSPLIIWMVFYWIARAVVTGAQDGMEFFIKNKINKLKKEKKENESNKD